MTNEIKRQAVGRYVHFDGHEEYECSSDAEAEALAAALNDAPPSEKSSWDDFMAWAKRTNHSICAWYSE